MLPFSPFFLIGGTGDAKGERGGETESGEDWLSKSKIGDVE